MNKPNDKRLNLIIAGFTLVGLAYLSALIVLLALRFYLALAIVSAGCFSVFLALFALFVVYNRKRKIAENAFSKAILSQLDEVRKGTPKLSPNKYGFDDLDEFQDAINAFLAAYANTSPLEEGPKYKGKRYLAPAETFEETMLEEIRANTCYRQAVLSIEISGPGDANEEVDKQAEEAIYQTFPYAMLSRRTPNGFYAYIYDAGSYSEFLSRLRTLVGGFACPASSAAVFSLRIGAAIFPLIPAVSLIRSAEKALGKGEDVYIDEGDKSIYLPSPRSNPNSRRIIAIANFEKLFRTSFGAKKGEREKTLREALSYFLKTEGFDRGGLVEYSQRDSCYRLVIEESAENALTASLSTLGNNIPPSYLDPVYEAAKLDFPLFVRHLKDAPRPVLGFMQSLLAESALFFPVVWDDEKFGLLYLLSPSAKDLSLEGFDKSHDLFSILATALIVNRRNEETEVRQTLINALAKRANKYVYTIDERTYEVKEATDNFIAKCPNYRSLPCHKLLYDRDSPCELCPLRTGTITRIVPSISMKESSISSVSRSKDGLATLIIEPIVSKNEPSGTLVDPALHIPSFKAFKAMLSRELIEKNGYMVGIRLTNLEPFLRQNPLESASSVLIHILSNLQSTPYYADAYRYDDNSLAVKLSGYHSKRDLYAAIETIEEAIGEPVMIGSSSFAPLYSFCAIAYPTEAAAMGDMVSLLKSELDRSEEMGEGYVAEVGRRNARKAGRRAYLKSLLNLALEKDAAEVGLAPIVELSTNKPVYYEAYLTLNDENKMVAEAELRFLLDDEKKRRDLDYSALRGLGILYRDYGKTLMKSAGVKGCYYRLKAATLLDEGCIPLLQKLVATYHFHRRGLGLLFEAKDLFAHGSLAKQAIERVADLGIAIGVYDLDSTAAGSDFPFDSIRLFVFDSGFVIDSMGSESTALTLLQTLDKIDKLGGIAVAAGLNEKETRYYAIETGFKLGKGRLYSSGPVSKEKFITSLTYHK